MNPSQLNTQGYAATNHHWSNMPLHRMLSAAVFAAICALGACAHRGTSTAAPVASSDSLAALVHSRFAVAPIQLELRRQRALIGLTRAAWADSSDAIQFDRAYDIARLVWDRYGASKGVDTVSVRTTFTPLRTQEYFFYPEQLTARERPRLGSAR
jgi:hypothetical protein